MGIVSPKRFPRLPKYSMERTKEAQTVACMIQIYCRGKHQKSRSLCPSCQNLLDYADLQLSKCPHGDDKPFCSSCPIHCYKPEMRDQIRQVMRYAGPRMLFHHPILAVQHLAEQTQSRGRSA